MVQATKWSFVSELVAKLVGPITNGILARILLPEAFGYVATINMVISFTDLFTDAGFQKYIIQHEFKDEEDWNSSVNSAFWSNLMLSFLLLVGVVLFRNEIARLTGNPDLSLGISIAALSLPLTCFTSIQTAVFRRKLDFKTIFYARSIGSLVPFLVTIPVALLVKNYWALVIGTLVGNAVSSIVLTILSSWRPQLKYSFIKFKEMFHFCYWILIESVLIWLTSYIGTFIVGRYLSAYDLGIYKTSMVTSEQILAIVTAATSPVIFSVISRFQNDRDKMYQLFLSSLRLISYILIPMGIGMYLYSDLVTYILLGNQWEAAIPFIGLLGIINAYGKMLGSYWDGMFNAVGKPKYSVITQFLYLVVLVPMLIFGALNEYEVLYKVRCASKIVYIVIQLIAVYVVFGINCIRVIKCVIPATLCSIPMFFFAIGLRAASTHVAVELCEVAVCVVIYFVTVFCVPESRKDMQDLFDRMNIKPLRSKKN